jgi:phosphoenolpyruvate carboxylase
LENLLSAGVTNQVFSKNKNELSLDEQNVMGQLASLGYKKYLSFKNHPKFIPYLEQMSTLKYYAKTNIGSRPSKGEVRTVRLQRFESNSICWVVEPVKTKCSWILG